HIDHGIDHVFDVVNVFDRGGEFSCFVSFVYFVQGFIQDFDRVNQTLGRGEAVLAPLLLSESERTDEEKSEGENQTLFCKHHSRSLQVSLCPDEACISHQVVLGKSVILCQNDGATKKPDGC